MGSGWQTECKLDPMKRGLCLLGLVIGFAGISAADVFVYTFTGVPGAFGLSITQTFTYTAPGPIALRFDVLTAALDSSSNVIDFPIPPLAGVEFDPLDTRFGFNTSADVIRVGIPLSGEAFYYFPSAAFSTPGVYSSTAPAIANAAMLTVSS